MALLHSVKRFLASEDGATGFENIVLVACIVILCLTIQIAAHRPPETSGARGRVRGRSTFPANQVA